MKVEFLNSRKLLGALAILSWGACLLSGVVWIRSYLARDLLPQEIMHSGAQLQSWDGRLFMVYFAITNSQGVARAYVGAGGDTIPHVPLPHGVRLAYAPTLQLAAARPSNFFGFDSAVIAEKTTTSSGTVLQSFSIRVYSVPYWAVFAMILFLNCPIILLWRRTRIRIAAGCCQKCGYDLRATPDLCPECGTVPGKS
jgi:hypothetical protein